MNNEMICKKNNTQEKSMEISAIGTKVSIYIIHKSNFCVFCIMRVLSLEMALQVCISAILILKMKTDLSINDILLMTEGVVGLLILGITKVKLSSVDDLFCLINILITGEQIRGNKKSQFLIADCCGILKIVINN